ncbi:RRQRL motif-containing zinc-binding protein [Kitasatospora sp. NPDC051984]|uniref:RRQRL motif-containing zinc-binding protein n=1 Tax=Kitasatospora sp. NPDC051984 TaxID=3364059 RepID=UPI0037CBA7D8
MPTKRAKRAKEPRVPAWDPSGEHHNGTPTYPWRKGPAKAEYATRRQLRAMGLRPNAQPVAAQIVSRGGTRTGYLYPVAGAAPVRPMTPARAKALAAAMRARSTCPLCHTVYDYCLPLKSLGCCLACHDGLGDQEREQLLRLTAAA